MPFNTRFVALALFLCILLIVFASPHHFCTAQSQILQLQRSMNSPIATGSGVFGSLQCTKDSTQTYAVCASVSNAAVKYNLQPFSFAAKGPTFGSNMSSCDLYETSNQSSSRVICVKSGIPGIVYFHRVDTMENVTNITIGNTSSYPHVVVDSANRIAYASNNLNASEIYKITNIDFATPVLSRNLSTFGVGDVYPASMILLGGSLFVHLSMYPASRLARVNISTFTWNKTVKYNTGEYYGNYDNVCADNEFIYVLTFYGTLVRLTYQNNNFARFDSLSTGNTEYSLAISPDSSFLLITTLNAGIILINTSTFTVQNRGILLNNNTIMSAFGRPIILNTSNEEYFPVCAFTNQNDFLYTFTVVRRTPEIYPRSPTPIISTGSGVQGSTQCTKDSTQAYAVCGSQSNTPIKYNLEPFSSAAKGPIIGSNAMRSCDLYETSNQSSSRLICVSAYYSSGSFLGIVYFFRVDTMASITNVNTGFSGNFPHVVVDSTNRTAYASNYHFSPGAVYKITAIDTGTPKVSASLTFGSSGVGDVHPAAMILLDGSLFVHFDISPARLARVNVSTFTRNKTIEFSSSEVLGGRSDNLCADDNFIYDLTQNGILVRLTYQNNNFSRFDSLFTGFGQTFSLAISDDLRTLILVSSTTGVLQMIDVDSFSMFGNFVNVAGALGRPIIMPDRHVYAFSQTSTSIYVFRYLNPTQSPTADETLTNSSSISASVSRSISHSASETSTPSSSASITVTASSSSTFSPSRTHSSSSTLSVSRSSTLTISTASPSTSPTADPSQTNSRSILDCRRIATKNQCFVPCQWCNNLGACVQETENCVDVTCASFTDASIVLSNSSLCPSSQCHYCSKSQTCLNKTEDPVCSCAVASSSSTTCAASSGECFWCNTNISFFQQPENSINLCVDYNNKTSFESQRCNCAFLSKEICSSKSSPCEWCDRMNSCIDPRIKTCDELKCTDFTPFSAVAGGCPNATCGVCEGICVDQQFAGANCDPSKFDEETCLGCHNCSYNAEIVLGVAQPHPYCFMSATPLTCTSPPTCNGININGVNAQRQCESSGCKYNTQTSLCENNSCFAFYLPSYVLQPFALAGIGYMKDVITLLLVGVLGDAVMRKVKRKIIVPFKFWKNNWDMTRIIPNLDRTIFVNDASKEDHDRDNRRESFEKYCERIAEEMFEIHHEEKNDEDENKKSSFVKKKVVDAVAFAFYNSGLWFDLDDEKSENEEITTKTIQLSSLMEKEEERKNDQHIINNNEENETYSARAEEIQPSPNETEKKQMMKIPLDLAFIHDRFQLQQLVNEEITKRATSVVYFASSQDASTRAASALNSFPSPLQLVGYVLGILALVLSAFYSVFLNRDNVKTINRISSYSCDAGTNSTSEISSVGDGKITFLLLGFRVMNSSSFATVMLLLVKTVRALWSSRDDRFFSLNLPQRLPIMSLSTQRSIQILLVFYFLLVTPFGLVGVTAGLQLAPCLIVCAVVIVALIADVVVLSLIRGMSAKLEASMNKDRQNEEDDEKGEQMQQLLTIPTASQPETQQQEEEVPHQHRRRRGSTFRKTQGSPRFGDDANENNNNNNNVDEWDEITNDEAALAAKNNSISNAAPTSLWKALLVFALSEELPTILLTFGLQMCFNYFCLFTYANSFGLADPSEIPKVEYDSRRLQCVFDLIAHDISGMVDMASSFLAFM